MPRSAEIFENKSSDRVNSTISSGTLYDDSRRFTTFISHQAKKDENDDSQHGDDNAPEQALITGSLRSHLLMKLLIGFLHVVGRATHIFVYDLKFLALEMRLRLHVTCDLFYISHHGCYEVDCLGATLDQVLHLMCLGLLVESHALFLQQLLLLCSHHLRPGRRLILS